MDGNTLVLHSIYPEVTPIPTRPPVKKYIWSEESFFKQAYEKLTREEAEAVRELYNFFKEKAGSENIRGGVGLKTGTLRVGMPKLTGSKVAFSLDTGGGLGVALANMYGISDEADKAIDNLSKALHTQGLLDREITHENYTLEGNKYPGIRIENWIHKRNELKQIISRFIENVEQLLEAT